MDAGASWLAGQGHGGLVDSFHGFATSLSVIPWWIGGFISRIRHFVAGASHGGLVDSFHGFAASFWHHPLLPSLSCFSNVDKVSTNPPEGFSEGRLMIWRWVPL
jgi:hypothetical protein